MPGEEDTRECDRCGSTILLEKFDEPDPLIFCHEDGESDSGKMTYVEEQRVLCSGCEDDLLEWIDEGDIDRSDCVDLPTTIEAARAVRRTANTLDQTADILESELETNDG